MSDARTLTRLLVRVIGTEHEAVVRRARDRALAAEVEASESAGRPDWRGQEVAGMLPRPRSRARAKRDAAERASREYLHGR